MSLGTPLKQPLQSLGGQLAWRMGAWTLLILGLLLLGNGFNRGENEQIALNRARDSYRKDLVYRLWASERGGVYVPKNALTPPNPYLAHIPNREITASDGRTYTLVNPAYMTRMVHELGARDYGLQGHITSLKPIRPENAPNPWERKALERFEGGAREFWEVLRQEGKAEVRYMGAFLVQEGCLRCHASQGYKVGEVRGGISVTVPLDEMETPRHYWMYVASLGLIWALGLTAILLWVLRRHHLETTRSRAVEALEESRNLYQALAEELPVNLFRQDAEGRLVYANRALLANLGGPLERFQGRRPGEFLDPGAAEVMAEEDARVLRGDTLRQVQTLAFQGPAGARVMEVMKSPLRDAEGRIIGLQGIALDLTERQVLDQRLRESLEHYRSILDTTLDGFLLLDLEGRVRDTNQAYCQLSGYSRDELLRLSIRDLEAAMDDQDIAMKLQELLRDGRGRFETRHRRKDGSQLDAEVSVSILPLLERQTVFIRDITDRKHAEASLEASERLYRSIFDDSPIAIWEEDFSAVLDILEALRSSGITNLRAHLHAHPEVLAQIAHAVRVLRVNAESQRLFGLDTSGRSPVDLVSHFCQASWAVFLEEIAALAEGASRFQSEVSVIGASGVPMALMMALCVVPGHEARLDRVLVSFLDLSDLKRAEETRRQLEQEVLQAQKLESLGSLAGGIAHDMNNVLGAILGLTSTLQFRANGDETLAKALGTIRHAAERGRDLVKGLTDFARKGLQEAQPVDLNEVVQKEKALLLRTTRQRVDLRLELQEPLPKVLGDPNAISNALMNLCINAIDAMPSGGTITLSTSAHAAWVELCVADTGEGMTPEVLARAKEPFFTTKPMGKGTGLGLAIVYGTLKAHGGTVEIQSEVGRGTRISLRLPAIPEPEPATLPQPGVPQESHRTLTILLVDDDELIRASVPEMLSLLGHRVMTASSGQDALAQLAAGLAVDLVILDHNMPGMSGAETLPRILELRPGLRVLVSTGFRDEALTRALEACPSARILPKPFSLDQIQQALTPPPGRALTPSGPGSDLG